MNCEPLECAVGEGEANLRVQGPETFATFEQHLFREVIQMNLYVGNLSYDATDDDLREAFESYGTVDTANVIRDHYSGRSRGFGFVEMPEQAEAEAAGAEATAAQEALTAARDQLAAAQAQATEAGGDLPFTHIVNDGSTFTLHPRVAEKIRTETP